MVDIVSYHHLSLSVRDLATSVEWYRNALGLEVSGEVEAPTFRRTRLRAPGSGLTLTLTQHEGAPADAFDERRTGLDHVAFLVGGVDDVLALKDRFDQLSLRHSEVKEPVPGTAMITLRDPDYIQLEVWASTAGGPTR